jgi:hypothetical protein
MAETRKFMVQAGFGINADRTFILFSVRPKGRSFQY